MQTHTHARTRTHKHILLCVGLGKDLDNARNRLERELAVSAEERSLLCGIPGRLLHQGVNELRCARTLVRTHPLLALEAHGVACTLLDVRTQTVLVARLALASGVLWCVASRGLSCQLTVTRVIEFADRRTRRNVIGKFQRRLCGLVFC